MSQDVVTARHGASDVVFTSDTDPFGGYFSGWQTLLVFALALVVTVIAIRRNGAPAGRVTVFLGLAALGMVQVAPYLFLLPQIRQYGVTFVSQLPQCLTQVAFVEAFGFPAFWLTVAPGKWLQKLSIALAVAIITAMPMSLYYGFAPYSAGLTSIGYQLLPTIILSGALFTLHLIFIALAPVVSGARAWTPPGITPA
jgi:hypothetical protein